MEDFLRNNAVHCVRGRRLKQGFSLAEIMIVVTIIALVAVVALMSLSGQIGKGYDARRKEDLKKFAVAFEDYYNDTGCYPTQAIWDDTCACGNNCLAPYMPQFLCDPRTREKYYYLGPPESCAGYGYRLYASLQGVVDPDIPRVGCDFRLGCGPGDLSRYNFGTAIGTTPLAPIGWIPSPTPTSATTPTGGPYLGIVVCTMANVCNGVGTQERVEELRCPKSFLTPEFCIAAGCQSANPPLNLLCLGER